MMQAARWHARRDIRIDSIPEPAAPKSGWVRLRVEVCGICGTDLEEYLAGPLVHPSDGSPTPTTLGHEIVGRVEETASGSALSVGTKVAVDGNLYCGECAWCGRGETTLCTHLAALGQGFDGGLAHYVLAPEYSCVPYEAEPEIAVFAEPLSVAVRGVRRGRVGIGDRVRIYGGGTIGLLLAQAARLSGAVDVAIVEPHPRRRDLALALGADRALAPDETDHVLPDATFDASGKAAVAALAVKSVRRGGRAVLMSAVDGEVPVDMMDLLMGEKQIIASLSHSYTDDFPTAVRLLESGAVRVKPLISDRIPLADVVTRGFEALANEPSEHLKVLVFPQGI